MSTGVAMGGFGTNREIRRIREMDVTARERREVEDSLRWDVSQGCGRDSLERHDYILTDEPVLGAKFSQKQRQRRPSLCAIVAKGAQSPDAGRVVGALKCLNQGRHNGFGLERKLSECGRRFGSRDVIGVPQGSE